jgi:hypothetical protein
MANVPITQKPKAGKTFTTQLLVPSLVRLNMSIFDRGDSYAGLVEPRGGRATVANLDTGETWNWFDLAGGEQTRGKLPEEDPERQSAHGKEKNGCL